MIRPEHFVMSATTFAPSGELDEAAFRLWLRRFRDVKIGVYVGSGGNGEGHALTPRELDRVYRIAVEELKGKVPVHANLPEEHTALQTINGHHDGGPLEHFDEPVQQTFVVVGSRLEVLFQDALRIPDGLNSQFLVAHVMNSTQQRRETN